MKNIREREKTEKVWETIRNKYEEQIRNILREQIRKKYETKNEKQYEKNTSTNTRKIRKHKTYTKPSKILTITNKTFKNH